MNKRKLGSLALCAGAHRSWLHCRSAAANESSPGRISRCYLRFRYFAPTEAFGQGLHEIGYVEGKNIVIEASIHGRETGKACRPRGGASPAQGRHHYGAGRTVYPRCTECHQDDSDRHDRCQ